MEQSIYASSIIIDPSTMGFLFRTQPPSVRCLQRPNVSNPGGAHGRSASGDKGFDLQLDDTWRTAKTSWVHLDAADGSLTGEELHDVTLPLSPSYHPDIDVISPMTGDDFFRSSNGLFSSAGLKMVL